MKKILTIVAAVAFSTALTAQSISVFHAGGNLSKFTGEDGKEFTKWMPGYQVGFTQDFGNFVSIEPGIFLIHKGGQETGSYAGIDYKYARHLNYLQIPVNLKFNFGIGDLRFVAGAGLYASVGLWGNSVATVDKITVKEKVKFFDKDADVSLKPFDFGAQVFAGINVGRFGVSVGYQPGFTTIDREDGKINNSSIYLNLSYALGEKDR